MNILNEKVILARWEIKIISIGTVCNLFVILENMEENSKVWNILARELIDTYTFSD